MVVGGRVKKKRRDGSWVLQDKSKIGNGINNKRKTNCKGEFNQPEHKMEVGAKTEPDGELLFTMARVYGRRKRWLDTLGGHHIMEANEPH